MDHRSLLHDGDAGVDGDALPRAYEEGEAQHNIERSVSDGGEDDIDDVEPPAKRRSIGSSKSSLSSSSANAQRHVVVPNAGSDLDRDKHRRPSLDDRQRVQQQRQHPQQPQRVSFVGSTDDTEEDEVEEGSIPRSGSADGKVHVPPPPPTHAYVNDDSCDAIVGRMENSRHHVERVGGGSSVANAAGSGVASRINTTDAGAKMPAVATAAAGATHDNGHPHQPVDRTSKDYYFDSYAHHAIHEEMLKDEVRTRTYEMAIMQNRHLFHNKIVLDVGCGTGILSMFAARAGAKQVYAVDCSTIINQARAIVEKNGFSDKVTLIKGKIEEITLPVDHVDIIISEWMGYFLLYESMLNTVLYARDKWLVPNGIIFPDKAVMYLTAVEDGNVKRDRFDFWNDVYGFDMTPIKEIAIQEPVVDIVDAKALVTDSVPILHLDILTCTEQDLEFTAKFKLQAQRNDYIHGLCAYFECAFTQIHKPIGFSTAPFARYTHWKQTILYLEDAVTICAGESIRGEITCHPNKRNKRDLDIDLCLNMKGRYSEVDLKDAHYRLR